MSTLSPRDLAAAQMAVRNGSASAIASYGVNLKPHLLTGRWLDASNQYAANCLGKLSSQTPHRTPGSVNPNELGEYLAASVATHNFDSWRYISNATSTLIDGDFQEAIHLSYYAELRASMSILASTGIGVVSGNNFSFDQFSNLTFFRGNTHSVIWPLLEEWTKVSSNSDRLLQSISIDNLTILEWINALSTHIGTVSSIALTVDIFSQWGLDLSSVGSDHNLRNKASYNPSCEDSISFEPDKVQALAHVIQTWEDIEPSIPKTFANLDREFLRNILIRVIELKTNQLRTSQNFATIYRNLIAKVLTDLRITNPKTVSILNRINPVNASSIIEVARNGFSRPDDVGGIYSRAFLLSRISTALTNDFLNDSGITWEEMSFWWKGLGERLWLWPHDEPYDSMADLWADTSDDLDNIMDTLTGNKEDKWYSLLIHNPMELIRIKRFDRALLWAVGQ